MRIPRIYTTQKLAVDQHLQLEDAASHHLIRVLRMQVGRPLILFNGEGGEYQAEISAINKRQVEVRCCEFQNENRSSPLTTELAIGISKGDRMDWVLQKATELGVSNITPLFCERSEVKLSGERLEKKHRHWQQILISACEQCQRNQLPDLHTPRTLTDYLEGCHSELKLVLHHRSATSPSELAKKTQPQSLSFLIGPEGGLSEEEIDQAQQHNFQPLLLGPRVLRTETAPLAALSLFQYLWGDL